MLKTLVFETIVQPGGIVSVQSDELKPGMRVWVTITLIDAAESRTEVTIEAESAHGNGDQSAKAPLDHSPNSER